MSNFNEQNIEATEVVTSKTEQFLQTNGKKVIYAVVALAIVIGGYFAVKALILEPRQEAAVNMMFMAQQRFGASEPDYAVALEGDADGAGFLDVIEQYGNTAAGNIATHYAGISYLKLGELEQAAKYLAMYKPVKGVPAALINAQNLCLQGDIASEQGQYAEAVKLYEAAAQASGSDRYSTPKILLKGALAAMAAGDVETADLLLTAISVRFPGSDETRNAQKIHGTIK